MLFYKNVAALDSETHRDQRFRRENFRFASDANLMLLACTEFSEASKEYPIAFTRAQDGEMVAVVVLGVRNAENVYVDSSGNWKGRYIPAYARRYPFIFSETAPDQLIVCIDESAEELGTNEGERLFDENGNASPMLLQMIEFMKSYQSDLLRSRAFIERLEKHGLLKEANANIRLRNGSEFAMSGIYMVDEGMLSGLDDTISLEFLRSGEMGWIYAHLISLSNLGRQADLMMERAPLQ